MSTARCLKSRCRVPAGSNTDSTGTGGRGGR
jgi:hypothetical protein